MFSDIPKLFEKNFLIGFYLPSLILIIIGTWLPYSFGITEYSVFKDLTSFLNMTIIVLIVWFVAILLMGLNSIILRAFEGYGKLNPHKLFAWSEKRKYRKLCNRILALEEKEKLLKNSPTSPHNLPEDEDLELTEKWFEKATNYPDVEGWLLPTRFGNVLRSFEVYPRVMYGAEAIIMWPRLQTVISTEFKEIIDSSNSVVNFWINMSFVMTLLFFESIGLYSFSTNWLFTIGFNFFILLIIGFLILAIAFYQSAIEAGCEWGDTIKSAFDVYLPALASTIGLTLPEEITKRIGVWNSYRIAVQFCKPDKFPAEWNQANGQPKKNKFEEFIDEIKETIKTK